LVVLSSGLAAGVLDSSPNYFEFHFLFLGLLLGLLSAAGEVLYSSPNYFESPLFLAGY
jgi:hypothetical protein